MSHLLTAVAGIVAGMIVMIHLRRAAIRYSTRGLPPPYVRPKIIRWEQAEIRRTP